jgi:hypothetical protein
VYRWEAGKRTPSPFYRERLCQVFSMSAEQLGLVELPVADLADAARTVTGGWGGPVGGSGDGLLPEAVDVLMRELWGDQVNRRAMLQSSVPSPPEPPLKGHPCNELRSFRSHIPTRWWITSRGRSRS